MADPAFTLRVPADPRYRPLATEVVARYFDLIGGSEPDRQALEAAFSRTLEELVGALDSSDQAAADVDVSCVNGPSGLELQCQCGGRTAVVRHPSPSAAR